MIISILIVRRRDITPPSSSAIVFMTPRPHELTIVGSVLSTPDTRLVK
jgi:hypothetical protein